MNISSCVRTILLGGLSLYAATIYSQTSNCRWVMFDEFSGKQVLSGSERDAINPIILNEKLNDITNSYKVLREKYDKEYLWVKGVDEVVRATLKGSIRYAPPQGKLALVVLNYGFDKGLKALEDNIRKESSRKLQVFFASKLEDLSKTNHQMYSQIMSVSDPGKFKEQAVSYLKTVDELKFNASVDENKILDIWKEEEFKKFTLEGFQQSKAEMLNLRNQVKQYGRDVVEMAKGISAFQRNIGEALKNIEAHEKTVDSALRSLDVRSLTNEKNIEQLQMFMFGELTPDQQIDALENGFLKGLPEQQKSQLKKAITFNKTISDIDNTFKATSQLLGAAKNFGIESQSLDDIFKYVNYAQTTVEAFASFYKGGPLGVINGVYAISTLFGRQRPDPVQQQLDRVFGYLQHMDAKLDTILAYQQRILDTLSQIRVDLARNHLEVKEKLNQIENDILYNRTILNSYIAEQSYKSCIDMTILGASQLNILNSPELNDLSAWRREFNLSDQEVCWKSIRTPYQSVDPNRLKLEFYAKTHVKDTLQNSNFEVVKRIFTYFLSVTKPNQLVKAYSPSYCYDDFSTKEFFDSVSANNIRIEPDLLYSPMVLKYAEFVANNCFLTYKTSKDSVSSSPVIDSIKKIYLMERLQNALNLVDNAVLQNVLLSGDMLLPHIYTIVNEKADSSKINDSIAIAFVLNNNSVIASNFIIYWLRTNLHKSKHSFSAYSIAYDMDSSAFMLNAVTGSNINYVPIWKVPVEKRDDKDTTHKWYILLDSQYYSAPTPDELVVGSFTLLPQVTKLVDYRKKLVNLIVELDIYNKVNDNTRLWLNTLSEYRQ